MTIDEVCLGRCSSAQEHSGLGAGATDARESWKFLKVRTIYKFPLAHLARGKCVPSVCLYLDVPNRFRRPLSLEVCSLLGW